MENRILALSSGPQVENLHWDCASVIAIKNNTAIVVKVILIKVTIADSLILIEK